MQITKNGNEITVAISGKFDRTSSPVIEAEVSKAVTDDVKKITFDLKDVIYVSSAGLRVILSFEKKMRKAEGKLVVKNTPKLVMDVFTETGLNKVLTME